MHSAQSKKLLSLLLSAVFAVTALLAPATALASRSTAANALEFVKTVECGQFTVGRDSNRFNHSSSYFPAKYELDAPFLNSLTQMATQTEYDKIINYMDKKWGGSCYGVASTMVLNNLTQYKNVTFAGGKGLKASDMVSGAKEYYDIGAPKNNRTALNYINYFMLSQFASKSRDGAVTQAWQKRYTDGSNSMYYYNLNRVVGKIMRFVDEGKPFQFGYGYEGGGHAIVGVDYYIVYRGGVPNSIYLKFYDENDHGSSVYYKTQPHFCFIKLNLVENTDPSSQDWCFSIGPATNKKHYSAEPTYISNTGNERIYICYYDYKNYKNNGTDKYTSKYITALRVRDMQRIYNNLYNGGGGMNFDQATYLNAVNAAGYATLTLSDVGRNYDKYYIEPFIYEDGDQNVTIPAEDCGVLYRASENAQGAAPSNPDEPFTELPTEDIVYPPVPVNDNDNTTFFENMASTEEPYRYLFHEGEEDPIESESTIDGEEPGFDMEIDLAESGNVDPDGLGAQEYIFDGYDLIISDGNLPGVSLEKGDNYARVSADSGVDFVRFSSDGRLRDVCSSDGVRGRYLELNFGSRSEIAGLDMFNFCMEDFGFLQVYDKQDNPDYQNCVILRTDGLSNGFSFTFYKGELVSDTYSGIISDYGDDVWIKICPVVNTHTGEIGAAVYVESVSTDPEGYPILPSFSGEPYFTTALRERVYSSGTSEPTYIPSKYNESRNEYSLKGETGGVLLPDGSVRYTIDAPFSKHTGATVDKQPLQDGVQCVFEEGSTIITLKSSFLATLKDGTHILEVYFTDGRMQTSFTTPFGGSVATAAVADVPATGGATAGATALLGALGVFAAGGAVRRKKSALYKDETK